MSLSFLYTPSFIKSLRWGIVGLLTGALVLSVRYFVTVSHLSKWPLNISGNVLERPEFFALSPQGVNYHVQADKVIQHCDKGYAFSNPTACLKGRKALELYGKGHHGFYEGKENVLSLEGNVEVTNGSAYYVQTPQALMYFSLKKVAGAKEVKGQCPYGRFWGQGFVLKKESLILKGPCRIRLTALK